MLSLACQDCTQQVNTLRAVKPYPSIHPLCPAKQAAARPRRERSPLPPHRQPENSSTKRRKPNGSRILSRCIPQKRGFSAVAALLWNAWGRFKTLSVLCSLSDIFESRDMPWTNKERGFINDIPSLHSLALCCGCCQSDYLLCNGQLAFLTFLLCSLVDHGCLVLVVDILP